MQKKKLVLIGGGGHCKSCIDVIEHSQEYYVFGILDHIELMGTSVLNYKVIGSDEDIKKLKEEECAFLITVGQIKSSEIRKKIFQQLIDANAIIATIISPLATVSKYAKIGKGTIVMHHANINAEACIGNNCIVNTGCIIEHESTIGDHTHISTAAVVNGNCIIGSGVFIGSNATVANNISIKKDVILGSGSVIMRNINESGTYVGNPLVKLRA